MHLLRLLTGINILYSNAQLSSTNYKCISNTTTIWCATIHSATNINYISSTTTIYPNNIFPYFCNDYSGSSYYYYHYQTDQNSQSNNIITFPSSTHCFDGSIILGACINIASFISYDTPSLVIGQSNLFNFKSWNMNPSSISIPLDKSIMDQNIYSNDLSRITITKYQSHSQCIEILNGIFPFGANKYYFIQGYIFKSDNNNKLDVNNIQTMSTKHNPESFLKISTTSDVSSANPIFNELFCFASIPTNDKYIHIVLELLYNNLNTAAYKFEYIIIDTNTYNGTINYKIDLIDYNTNNGYINVKYWERCDSNIPYNTQKKTNNNNAFNYDINDSDKKIYSASTFLSHLSSTFLIVISIIGFIIIIVVSIVSNKYYPSGDPINYFALIWMVLELWDFWSDISFTIYLYIISLYYPSPFFVLFMLSLTCVIIPYILNISYFKHLTSLWSKQIHACQAPKEWLNNKCYFIYFLLISLITGGVFPAIELSNSVLIPYPLFTMRVPYFELVRVRTERFITNVLFENLPFLILQIGFYYAIKSLNSKILFSTVGGFVFLGTVLSSILSVLFSGTYYFSYKGKSALPIAVYKLQITIECTNNTNEIKNYWKYSIWRMQTAISKAFQVSSPTLIMIDSVDIIDKKIFNISCRLLYDEAPFGNQTNIKILLQQKNDHSVTGDLCSLFTKEFQLTKKQTQTQIPNNSGFWTINSLRVSNCSIGRINGGEGELVYDYGNSLIKTICCYVCKCGKRGVKRMSTKDVMALYKKKSENRYNKPIKSHIRNVSAMKAAFGKHHKISDAKQYKPTQLKSHTSTTVQPTHKRIESNISNSSRVSKTYDKPLPAAVNSPSSHSNFKSPQFSPISPSGSGNMNKVQTIEEEDEDEDDQIDVYTNNNNHNDNNNHDNEEHQIIYNTNQMREYV